MPLVAVDMRVCHHRKCTVPYIVVKILRGEPIKYLLYPMAPDPRLVQFDHHLPNASEINIVEQTFLSPFNIDDQHCRPKRIEPAHTTADRAPDVSLDSSRAAGLLRARMRGAYEVLSEA